MSSVAALIKSNDLSIAWAQAFLVLQNRNTEALSPLVVNIRGLGGQEPSESLRIRESVDVALDQYPNLCSSLATANTIFPANLWALNRVSGRDAFFERYLKDIFPRLQRDNRRNSKGTYFQRMLDYGPNHRNQLKLVLDNRQSGTKRRSALQLLIFDPEKDHSASPYLPFPCLDHVAFAPDSDGGLSVTATYANQYVFDRAYGNYLGLCELGRFVADQLGLRFTQLTCLANVATTGSIKAADAKRLAAVLASEVPSDTFCSIAGAA